MQGSPERVRALGERLGRPLEPGSRVLDFGCGQGRTVDSFLAAGFDAWGCDLPVEIGEGHRLRTIEDPYKLPFPDDHFSFVCSEQVMEHVQDHAQAFAEIARVLAPGGWSIHFYPPRWAPIEPHTFIPLATVIQSRKWCYLWARLGIRNQFQKGLSAAETAERNHRYLIAHTSYPPRREMARLASAHFSGVDYVESQYLAARNGRFPPALGRVYSGLRTRVLYTER